MADEPKPAEPAPQPSPPAAAPAGGAGAAAAPPPGMMIGAAVGGLVVLILLIVLIRGCFFGGGLSMPGSSPDLGTAEKSATSYVKFREQKRIIEEEWSAERSSKQLESRRALLPWMADKSAEEKEIKKTETWVAAYKKHGSALRDFKVAVVEGVKDGLVKLKLTGKKLDPDGENWKLVDRSESKEVALTQIEGKWKVKGGGD